MVCPMLGERGLGEDPRETAISNRCTEEEEHSRLRDVRKPGVSDLLAAEPERFFERKKGVKVLYERSSDMRAEDYPFKLIPKSHLGKRHFSG